MHVRRRRKLQDCKVCRCWRTALVHTESDGVWEFRSTWWFPGALGALASLGGYQEPLLDINTDKTFDTCWMFLSPWQRLLLAGVAGWCHTVSGLFFKVPQARGKAAHFQCLVVLQPVIIHFCFPQGNKFLEPWTHEVAKWFFENPF